jgi:hypothetical protein
METLDVGGSEAVDGATRKFRPRRARRKAGQACVVARPAKAGPPAEHASGPELARGRTASNRRDYPLNAHGDRDWRVKTK